MKVHFCKRSISYSGNYRYILVYYFDILFWYNILVYFLLYAFLNILVYFGKLLHILVYFDTIWHIFESAHSKGEYDH